eukprot:03435.XXX_108346_108498_1 [CDS] Oithona nana genome sequencing.
MTDPLVTALMELIQNWIKARSGFSNAMSYKATIKSTLKTKTMSSFMTFLP